MNIKERLFYSFMALLSLLPYLDVPQYFWELTHFLFSRRTEGGKMSSRKHWRFLALLSLSLTFNVKVSTNKLTETKMQTPLQSLPSLSNSEKHGMCHQGTRFFQPLHTMESPRKQEDDTWYSSSAVLQSGDWHHFNPRSRQFK